MQSSSNKDTPILIAGGGGFIGGWLVQTLLAKGFPNLRVVDCKTLPEWCQVFPQVDSRVLDLRLDANSRNAVRGMNIRSGADLSLDLRTDDPAAGKAPEVLIGRRA